MGENPEAYEMIVPNNDFNELLLSADSGAKNEKLQEIAARNGTLDDIKNMQTYRYQNKDILTAVSDEDAKIIDQFLLENNIVYNGDVYKLIIRDRNEHAWVEIFDDYLGWIPIEAIGAGVISQVDETSPVTDNDQNDNQTTPILPNQEQEEISTETESTIVIPFYVYFLGFFIIGLAVIVLQAVIRRKRRFKDAKNNNQLVCFYCHYLSKLNGDLSGIKKIGDKICCKLLF